MEFPALDASVWAMIEGATSASYTPVEDDDANETGLSEDSDVGRYLLAVVSYTDAKQNVVEVPRDMAGLVSVNPVAKDTRNRAPVFERPGFRHPWHAEPDRDERGGGEHQGQRG